MISEILGGARAQADRESAEYAAFSALRVWETAPLDGTQRGAYNGPGFCV